MLNKNCVRLGYPEMTAAFLSDIFGSQVSFELFTVRSTVEVRRSLTQHCEGLKTICNTREKPCATASGPQFYSFFCQYQANVIKYHMCWDVSEAAGFGSPPSTFTTNSSESKNAELKWKVAIYSSCLNHREMKLSEHSLVEVNTEVYFCVGILCAMAVALSLLYPFSAFNKKTVFSLLTVVSHFQPTDCYSPVFASNKKHFQPHWLLVPSIRLQ